MLIVNIARVVSLLAVILWGLIVVVAAVFREFRESNHLLPWLIVLPLAFYLTALASLFPSSRRLIIQRCAFVAFCAALQSRFSY